MNPNLICQSCTMPIDNEAERGTEKDGSKNCDYCKYCYRDGGFTEPDMTLAQMQELVETKMKKMNLPETIIRHSLHALPGLVRWQKVPV